MGSKAVVYRGWLFLWVWGFRGCCCCCLVSWKRVKFGVYIGRGWGLGVGGGGGWVRDTQKAKNKIGRIQTKNWTSLYNPNPKHLDNTGLGSSNQSKYPPSRRPITILESARFSNGSCRNWLFRNGFSSTWEQIQQTQRRQGPEVLPWW